MHILLPILSLLAAGSLCAQTPGFQPFGTGCTFDNQTLAIGNQGLPRIGQSFRITYSGPNHTTNFAQQIAWPQLVLGFTLQSFPIPTSWFFQQPAGCNGELLPAAVVPSPVNAALPEFDAFFDMAIPNDPGLVGVVFLAQWLTIHQQCGFAGCGIDAALTSDAALAVIGV